VRQNKTRDWAIAEEPRDRQTETNRQTDQPTDRPRYSVCNNRPHLRSTVMRPNNTEIPANIWQTSVKSGCLKHTKGIWRPGSASPGPSPAGGLLHSSDGISRVMRTWRVDEDGRKESENAWDVEREGPAMEKRGIKRHWRRLLVCKGFNSTEWNLVTGVAKN